MRTNKIKAEASKHFIKYIKSTRQFRFKPLDYYHETQFLENAFWSGNDANNSNDRIE